MMKFMRARLERSSLFLIIGFIFVTVSGCGAQVINDSKNSGALSDVVGKVESVGAMSTKRAAHTATLLPNGKVLIAGGFVSGGRSLATAELYDAERGSFVSIGNMTAARAGHTATLLPSGKVLIAGGYDKDYLNSAEIFDPATNSFIATSNLVIHRSEHTAVRLNDGKILIAGGVGTGWTFLSGAEIYDPVTSRFSATGSMSTPRESHTATLLNDGRVLVTGGHKDRRENVTIYRSAEIFDPATQRFSPTGDLTVKRHKHEATRLPDGRVLILGGSDERDGGGAYKNAEIFDPAKATFSPVANNMNTARYKLQGTAVVLRNGTVLIAGGADRAEIFDPATNTFRLAGGSMGTKRLFSTATMLKNGKVLITGGYHDGNNVSESAWIFSV